jgi:hypothetical protein
MVLHINMFNMVGMIKIISFTSIKNKLCFEGDSFYVFKSTIVYIQRTKLTINRLKMITNNRSHVIGKDICPFN